VNSDVFEIAVKGMIFRYRICPGVYPPSEDTYLLLESLTPGKKVLEIGCGSGLLSVYCAALGSEVTAVDINPLALNCTEMNSRLNHVQVETLPSDLFEKIDESYDSIIFNPPYLPSEDDVEGSEQWNGGKDGFKVTKTFLNSLESHLNTGGSAWIVLSSLTDIQSLIDSYQRFIFQKVRSVSFFMETLNCYRISLKEKQPLS
jgi:release factor glutamine methyltransferase